jgi:hypothetical protein
MHLLHMQQQQLMRLQAVSMFFTVTVTACQGCDATLHST